MAHSSCIKLNCGQKTRLLEIARESISNGLSTHRALTPDAADCTGVFAMPLASFVTLTRAGALRGCIGSLRATRPLVQDVAHAAFAAAYKDPRFAPLSAAEFESTTIAIAVLTIPERMQISSEQELLDTLVPHQDGLILEDKGHNATFLPKVWENLPDPRSFLTHLKHKAGLPTDYWSDTIKVHHYRALSFSEPTRPGNN